MRKHFMTIRPVCIIAALCWAMVAPRAVADATTDAEEQAIRAAAKDYAAALRRGDADALRALWTAEGDYVDPTGQTFKAHELISQLGPAGEAAAEPAEADEATPATSTLRFITPDVAIEDGASVRGLAEDGAELVGRFSAIWVKRDGTWLLDGVRESESLSPPGRPELKALAWLVGEWADAADDADDPPALAAWQWCDGGNFLLGEFVVYGQGGQAVGGTQRIGWDPAAKQIKSWIFDSQGGQGEGRWRRDGDRWIVESTHVLADGRQATSKSVYLLNDSGDFILEVSGDWGSTSPDADGEQLPAQRFEFRRAIEE